MYQFPKWRYWLVIIVLVVGTIAALPNLYPLTPALQLASAGNAREPIKAEGEEAILGILQAQNVPVEESYLQDGRLFVRFANEEAQANARSAILESSKNEYAIALTKLTSAPALFRKLGLKPMSLGLDLRGGVHLLYEVDIESAVGQALERLERSIRSQLKEKRIGYLSTTTEGNLVRVILRQSQDLEDAVKLIRAEDPDLIVETSQDAEGRSIIRVRFTPAQIKQRQDFAIQQNVITLRNRVDELGVSEPIVARQGAGRVLVELPGVSDPADVIRLLGATATLEFRLVDEAAGDPFEAQQTGRVPVSSKLYRKRDGNPVLLKREIIVSGDQLTDASFGFSQGEPAVNVRLDARGGAEMLETTRQNVNRGMAVVFIEKKRVEPGEPCNGVLRGNDCTEEEVISVATIRGVFSSSFQITGVGAQEGQELALLLRAGALAVPNYLVEQRTVGPSLGEENIERGWTAMIIGLILTFIFMAVYYRAFGWVANAVLLANLILTVGLLSIIQASLSLPGIAAVIFHLGIAVDANILIYERIREELRNGNSPHAAINAGFDKAFATIADSNVTTLIAGVVLFAFGTGTIRSFAIVMTLGIITSLFTAIVGSRALVHAVWGTRRRIEHLSI